MTLKCSEDGRPEDLSRHHAVYVCHHCGRPVCQIHGRVVSADDAFDDSAEDLGDRIPSVRRVPQPAMHCTQCAEEHHRRADKHPGWKDPKVVRAEETARAARERAAAAAARAAQQQPPPPPPAGPQYPAPQYPGPGQYPAPQYPRPQYPGPGPQYPGPGPYPGQPWPPPGQWGPPQPGQPGYPRPQQPGPS
jgi:hypothetical protein